MLTIGMNAKAAGVVTGGDKCLAVLDLADPMIVAKIQGVLRGRPARLVVEASAYARTKVARIIGKLPVFPVHRVLASSWQSGLAMAAFKEAPLRRAKALYPDADLGSNHLARAASLLIAHWQVAGRRRSAPSRSDRSFAISTRARTHARGKAAGSPGGIYGPVRARMPAQARSN